MLTWKYKTVSYLVYLCFTQYNPVSSGKFSKLKHLRILKIYGCTFSPLTLKSLTEIYNIDVKFSRQDYLDELESLSK